MRSTKRPDTAENRAPTKKNTLTVKPISASLMSRLLWICTARALVKVGARLAAVVTSSEAATSAPKLEARTDPLKRAGDPVRDAWRSRPRR